MYYSKISCNVEKSLEKLKQYEVSKMIGIDYSAIVTVTDYGKIQIDGSQNHSIVCSIADDDMVSLISKWMDRIYKVKEAILILDDRYDLIVTPIRYYKNYYVFTLFAKKGRGLTEKEVKIAEFLTSAIYENVMLDYQIVNERNYLKSIFDSTTSFILTLDLNQKVIAVNKKIAQLIGEQEGLIGKDMSALLNAQQYAQLQPLYLNVVKTGIPISGEEEFLLADGKKYYVHYTLSPMIDKDGDVNGVVALGLDVTKQKIYEKEIEQLKQYALLGEISAEVSHDIKNPLMSIKGCAKLLQKKIGTDASWTYVEPIIQEVDRINAIIDQMLAYSRLSHNDGFHYLDIHDVLDKCIDAVSFHKQFKYIDIKKQYADDLPYLKGSDIRLQQALMNILLNSIQAIEEEGFIFIKTENNYTEKQIWVAIQDNGVGIEEQEKDRIFEPFYTTKPHGTGLGLSIVKKVLHEFGGQHFIESTPNMGTQVLLKIPYEITERG